MSAVNEGSWRTSPDVVAAKARGADLFLNIGRYPIRRLWIEASSGRLSVASLSPLKTAIINPLNSLLSKFVYEGDVNSNAPQFHLAAASLKLMRWGFNCLPQTSSDWLAGYLTSVICLGRCKGFCVCKMEPEFKWGGKGVLKCSLCCEMLSYSAKSEAIERRLLTEENGLPRFCSLASVQSHLPYSASCFPARPETSVEYTIVNTFAFWLVFICFTMITKKETKRTTNCSNNNKSLTK